MPARRSGGGAPLLWGATNLWAVGHPTSRRYPPAYGRCVYFLNVGNVGDTDFDLLLTF